ncbi:MAG: cytochrome C oxidase subunit IV family protein [Phycisphaeraceae bacterium]
MRQNLDPEHADHRHTPQSTPSDRLHQDPSDQHVHDELAHPMPLATLGGVFVGLLILTAATVGITWVDLGALNIWFALLIAVIKAGLVALYFMHLRYDAPFNGVVLLAALLFVAIFIGAAITDSRNYMEDYRPPRVLSPTR